MAPRFAFDIGSIIGYNRGRKVGVLSNGSPSRRVFVEPPVVAATGGFALLLLHVHAEGERRQHQSDYGEYRCENFKIAHVYHLPAYVFAGKKHHPVGTFLLVGIIS